MSGHRASRPRRLRGSLVVLRGGLDLARAGGAGSACARSRQDELDWASFAERIGFGEQTALPDDYEERLVERIFGAEALASDADWTDQGAPVSRERPRSHARTRSRRNLVMGLLVAAAAVLIAWTSVGSPSRVASPDAAARDASSPAVHAIDAAHAPEPMTPDAVLECPSEESVQAPEPTRETQPDPGAQLAKHRDERRKKGGQATPRAASMPRSLRDEAALPGPHEPSFIAEVVEFAAELPQAEPVPEAKAPLAQRLEPSLFDERFSAQLDPTSGRVARTFSADQSWGLTPTGDRWLGVSAQPSDVNAPRAIAVTAQIDVTRAFARF